MLTEAHCSLNVLTSQTGNTHPGWQRRRHRPAVPVGSATVRQSLLAAPPSDSPCWQHHRPRSDSPCWQCYRPTVPVGSATVRQSLLAAPPSDNPCWRHHRPTVPVSSVTVRQSLLAASPSGSPCWQHHRPTVPVDLFSGHLSLPSSCARPAASCHSALMTSPHH